MRLLGKSSPSFVIAIGLMIAGCAAYVAWRIWWPNPVRQSDRIVRGFARDARDVVRSYRRALRATQRRSTSDAPNALQALETIDAKLEEAVKELERRAEDTEARLDEIEGISIRTLRNRLGRVRKRLEEARVMIYEEASRAKSRYQESTAGSAKPARAVVLVPSATS